MTFVLVSKLPTVNRVNSVTSFWPVLLGTLLQRRRDWLSPFAATRQFSLSVQWPRADFFGSVFLTWGRVHKNDGYLNSFHGFWQRKLLRFHRFRGPTFSDMPKLSLEWPMDLVLWWVWLCCRTIPNQRNSGWNAEWLFIVRASHWNDMRLITIRAIFRLLNQSEFWDVNCECPSAAQMTCQAIAFVEETPFQTTTVAPWGDFTILVSFYQSWWPQGGPSDRFAMPGMGQSQGPTYVIFQRSATKGLGTCSLGEPI